MNTIIEEIKKDFSGSDDYLSGVNDGLYQLNEFLKGNHELCIVDYDKEQIKTHQIVAFMKLKTSEHI